VPIKVNTYLYDGYPGENFGDELIFETVSGFLMPAQPRFVGRFTPPFQRVSDFLDGRRITTAVVGGGGVSPSLLLEQILTSRSKFDLHTFGIGKKGSLDHSREAVEKKSAETWKKIINATNCEYVSCRGPLSKDWFDSVGIPARVTADTAFAAFDFLMTKQNDLIAVNFGRHHLEFKDSQILLYEKIIDILIRNDTPILIIPFHDTDLNLARALMKKNGGSWGNCVRALDYIPSVMQFRSMLPRFVFGVGERLHFSIPLLASGIPSIILSYSQKHQDVAQSVFCQNYVIENLNSFEALDRIESLSQGIIRSGAILSAPEMDGIESARNIVRKQFEKVQCILNGSVE
jgi:hypothetical protein